MIVKITVAEHLPRSIAVTEAVQIRDVTEPAEMCIRRMRISYVKSVGYGRGFITRSKLLRCAIASSWKLVGCSFHLRTSDGDGSGTSTVDTKIRDEVNAYLHLESLSTSENPLDFWKRQHINFPYLSLLAKNYLSVSASRVTLEAVLNVWINAESEEKLHSDLQS